MIFLAFTGLDIDKLIGKHSRLSMYKLDRHSIHKFKISCMERM